MGNSRRTAAFIVSRWLATHEFPNEMLPQGGEDRAFVQDLVYTVVRRFRPLRTILGKLMKTWPKGELEALVLVGAAQILFMPDVPDFAAVNETVAAAKISGKDKRLDRVVNGVLRNLIRRRDEFEAEMASASLAERESYPNALVKRWIARWGEEKAEELAKWHNTPAETYLAYPGGKFEKLARGKKVTDVEGFDEGAFLVQDPATAGAIELLDVRPGQNVLDFCAAPGGKTVQIAWRLGGEGRLVAQEVNPRRLKRLQKNLQRMKLDYIETTQSIAPGHECPGTMSSAESPTSDAKHLTPNTKHQTPNAQFDRVLVDAPCSNTGVLRRRPDARWRWEQDHIKQLTDLQHDILNDAAKYVAPGGLLVYSTCSNEPEENGDQVEKFLAEHPDFEEVSRRESIPFETKHDGAFACAMKFIGKALACLLVVLMAGCASFEPTRTQKFVDEKGEYALVDYGSDKEPRTSTFTLSNGVTLPFKSKLKVRVELPNGDRFIAYQRMSTAGNLYIDEDERWEFFERGTGCVVAHRKKSDSKFEMIYQGTLCASVRNPFAEKKPTIRSDSSTPHGFGRDSSGPRTVEERK